MALRELINVSWFMSAGLGIKYDSGTWHRVLSSWVVIETDDKGA